VQCNALQAQLDKLSSERRRRGSCGGGGFFKWSAFWFGSGMGADVARVNAGRRQRRIRAAPPRRRRTQIGASQRHEMGMLYLKDGDQWLLISDFYSSGTGIVFIFSNKETNKKLLYTLI